MSLFSTALIRNLEVWELQYLIHQMPFESLMDIQVLTHPIQEHPRQINILNRGTNTFELDSYLIIYIKY